METLTVCSKDEQGQFRLSDFEEICATEEAITSAFFSITPTATQEAREVVFSKLTQLYFKVRVHHECRLFKERLRHKTKSTKSSTGKGLRKSLQTKTCL
ncbi:hypothetical protein BaRGS_00011499 [Batillaria attramentaria]